MEIFFILLAIVPFVLMLTSFRRPDNGVQTWLIIIAVVSLAVSVVGYHVSIENPDYTASETINKTFSELANTFVGDKNEKK